MRSVIAIAQETGPSLLQKPNSCRTPGNQRDPPADCDCCQRQNLSGWSAEGSAAKWKVIDGYAEVAPGAGDILTRDKFGDAQLHIEWATPAVPKGEGQDRGNSGVFLMERYEVQVLDSYNNKTYYHGQAGSVYKQHAPLVNASRRPGEWQAYDIVFRAPRFDEQGKVIDRARVTVFHNGVLIQNNAEIYGITYNDRPSIYIAHSPLEPLRLQDHGNPTRYRNIWIRRLSVRSR